jgi:hypothetical protein
MTMERVFRVRMRKGDSGEFTYTQLKAAIGLALDEMREDESLEQNPCLASWLMTRGTLETLAAIKTFTGHPQFPGLKSRPRHFMGRWLGLTEHGQDHVLVLSVPLR